MFLSKPDILKRLGAKELRFDPPVPPERIAQVSVDLLLGRRFITFKDKKTLAFIGSIQMDPALWGSLDLWDTKQQDTFLLAPNTFVLAQTLESVHIPNSLMGLVEGRSSYARIGVTVHATAPKIDPGFNGHITLEMTNLGNVPVQLRAGIDQPAQLLLAEIRTPLEEDEVYGTGPDDKFQGQTGVLPGKP